MPSSIRSLAHLPHGARCSVRCRYTAVCLVPCATNKCEALRRSSENCAQLPRSPCLWQAKALSRFEWQSLEREALACRSDELHCVALMFVDALTRTRAVSCSSTLIRA